MDFNIQPGQLAKNGLRVTMLAAAVAVASCGGGGSSSSVKNAGNNPSTPTAPSSKYHLLMETSKPNLTITGDTAEITLKVFDNLGGGVVDQTVSLQLPDVTQTGLVIEGASSAKTDAQGLATFKVKLSQGGSIDQQELLEKGILLTGVLIDSNNAQSKQVLTLNVVQAGSQISQYTLDVAADHSPINVKGDLITVSVLARDSSGAGAVNQRVTLSLPNVVSGVTIDGNASTVTNESGLATFKVKVASNLTTSQITTLLEQGVVIAARLVESNSAQVSATKMLSAAQPSTQFGLAIATDAGAGLNVYGDTVEVSVKLTSLGVASPENQTVTVALLPKIEGVGFEGATTAKTDATGLAKFTLTVPKDLSTDAINALLSASIGIGATVTETSGATQSTAITLNAVRPAAQYNIQIEKDKTSLLASGDVMNVTARVLDIKGGGVSKQNVSLALTSAVGIVIDGPSMLTTDDKGKVVFSVIVSDKLTKAQQDALVTSGLSFSATLLESSGASVTTPTQSVTVNQSGSTTESQYEPVITFSKSKINAYGDDWQVVVKAKDSNGGGVADQSIVLKLPKVNGLVIDGASTQITNDKGEAIFVIKNKSLGDLSSLLLEATLTESNGAKSTSTATVVVEKPAAQYTPVISLNQNEVGVDGGTVDVLVRALNNIGGSVAGQQVTLSLPPNMQDAVIDGSSTMVTNAQGVASFKVIVKSGIAAQTIGLGAVIVESNGAVSQAATSSIVVVDVQADYTLKIAGNKTRLNVLGDSITITTQLASKSGSSVTNQTIALAWNPQASGISVGSLTAKTDNSGVATFNVQLSDLTADERKALLSTNLTFSAAMSRNSQTVQAPTLSVIAYEPASKYQLSVQLNKSKLNVEGDTAVVTVQANNLAGGTVAGQSVRLELSPQTTGIYVQGDSLVQTDDIGQAKFTISLAGLDAIQKQSLIASGLQVKAVLTEVNGATASRQMTIAAHQPSTISDYQLTFRQSQPRLNVYGDSLSVTVLATDQTGKAVANQSVTMSFPAIAGLNLTSLPTMTTNTSGQAVFTFSLDSTLSDAERQELLNKGVALTAILTESSGETATVSQSLLAYEPATSYQLAMMSSDSVINVRGDEVTISIQVLDSQGKFVENQLIDLGLSGPASLVLLNNELGTIRVQSTTDNVGVAKFTVKVPASLTATERQQLISSGLFATARLTEKTGAKTVQTMSLNFANPISTSQFSVSANAMSINAGDSFTVNTEALNEDQQALVNQQVTFALSSKAVSAGITVDDVSKTTDANGRAQFVVTVPKDVDIDILNQLINYAVTLTEQNGSFNTQTATMSINQPVRHYGLTLAANKIVQTSGDTFKVFARATDAAGNPAANQSVRLSVADPIRTGVTVKGSAEIQTDADGLAIFELTLTPGANVDPTLLANGIVLGAALTEDNGVVTRQALVVPVDTLNTSGQYLLSWTQSKASFDSFGDEIEVTYRVTNANGGVLVGVPVSLQIQDALTVGAILTTSSTLVTNEEGLVVTRVRLIGRELDALLGDAITLQARVQAAVFDANGDTQLSTLAQQAIILPKSGSVDVDLLADRSALFAGESTSVHVVLKDNNGQPIANAPVNLINTNASDKIVNAAPILTDAFGKATFNVSYSALTFDANGRADLQAIILGQTIQKRSAEKLTLVSASEAGFSFIALPAQNSTTAQFLPVTVRVRGANAADLTGNVVLTTSLGRLSATMSLSPSTNNQVTIALDGSSQGIEAGSGLLYRDVVVYLYSEYPGLAVLGGQFGQESVSADVRLRATVPSKLMLQAEETTLQPNQSTRIVAIVKDANDSPVSGVTVRFERMIDSSAGRLSQALAVTNDSGVASVIYTAGTSSPVDRVEINAVIDEAPAVTAQPGPVQLTVAKEPTSIIVGNSNKVSVSEDHIYYYHAYSVAVMDGKGKPVPNQIVSLRAFASEYLKGQYIYHPAETRVVSGVVVNLPPFFTRESVSCSTEDQNRNFTLDLGEDLNGNGQIEVRNPVALVQNVTDTTDVDENAIITFKTDAEGKFDFRVRYPKIYAEWVRFELKATTLVSGSEYNSVTTHNLPVLVDDVNVADGGRPNMQSPEGVSLSCQSPN